MDKIQEAKDIIKESQPYRLLQHGELVKDGDEKWSDYLKEWIALNPWDRGIESYHGDYYKSRWQPVRRKISQEIDDYDCGLLNDHGGGDVQWWWDYIRSEIAKCNDYWRQNYE